MCESYRADTPSLFTRYDVNELRERAFYLSKETKSERDALEAIACALVARSKESGRRGSLTHQRRHTNTHGKGDWEETVPSTKLCLFFFDTVCLHLIFLCYLEQTS